MLTVISSSALRYALTGVEPRIVRYPQYLEKVICLFVGLC